MARKVTSWRPDTCRCQILYEWDDAVPAESRTFTPVESDNGIAARTCAIHQGLGVSRGDQAHYATVLGENQLKNNAHGAYAEGFPGAPADEFLWAFTADRTLWIAPNRTLTNQQSNALNNRLNQRLGPDMGTKVLRKTAQEVQDLRSQGG